MDTAATQSMSNVSVLVFGISLGTMGVIVLLITALLSIVIAVAVIRSKKKPENDLTSVSEPPTIIDTERNVAYEVVRL
jgi:flagellar biosynthesis protein FliP